jgi:hypothetical protein
MAAPSEYVCPGCGAVKVVPSLAEWCAYRHLEEDSEEAPSE